MKAHFIKSVTLLELIASVVILSFLVIIFAIMELYSHSQVLGADRRSKVQNIVSTILEHNVKVISTAVGNEAVFGSNSLVIEDPILGDKALRVYVDENGDGRRNNDTSGASGPYDALPWRAYRFNNTSHNMSYCGNCTFQNGNCDTCNNGWSSLTDSKITDYDYNYTPGDNYIDVIISGCWDPDNNITPAACGSSDKNPSVSMKARIKMPAVAVH